MRPRLRAWINVYEGRIGRKLEADDYLFPYIGPNGVIYPKKMETRDGIQKRMNDFASGARINKHFTTHSPRRGGAQYRFMFAPIGERWSLNIIRWWGGWAEGEHVCLYSRIPICDSYLTHWHQVDTLIKYLINSLQRYENGHGDALRPVPTEMDKSFNGDHMLLNVVTGAEIREMTVSMRRCFDEKVDEIKEIFLGTAPDKLHGSSPLRTGVPTQTLGSLGFHASPPSGSGPPLEELDHPVRRNLKSASPTTPGISIQNIKRGPDAWWEAVKQWNEDDPVTGAPALKHWDREWYERGANKEAFGMKRTQRRYIAEAFERCTDIFCIRMTRAKYLLGAALIANVSFRSILLQLKGFGSFSLPFSRSVAMEEKQFDGVARMELPITVTCEYTAHNIFQYVFERPPLYPNLYLIYHFHLIWRVQIST